MENTEFWVALAESLEIEPSKLSREFELPGKGNWESLILLSTISAIDKYFNLTLESAELEMCGNVGDLCLLINKKVISNN